MSYIDDFITEAEKDDRLGDQEAIVHSIEPKTWPSGDPFHKLVVALINAGSAKADCNLQPIPDEGTLAAIKASGDRKKIRGVASSIQLMQQLEKHYGITDPSRIMVGAQMSVKTVKNKEGFVRVIAFLPKGSVKAGATTSSTPASTIPF